MNRAEKSVLIIVQNLPVPFDRRVWQEATSLRQAGYDVAVICPKKKMYSASYEQLEGVDIYRYPLICEAGQSTIGYFVEFMYCWMATLFLSIRVYTHRRFHVIHACNPPDTFFALALLFRPLGVKFVFDHHDLSPEMYVAKRRPRRGALYQALLALERWTLKTADLVIAVNESHKEVALRRGGVPESKVIIVRSGPRRGWGQSWRPLALDKHGKRFLVLYLGEMCEQDGVDYLLRAIAGYVQSYGDDTLFVLVGGGPDQPRMHAMANHMGLAPVVHFTGRVPDEELWSWLSSADVCVDPDPFTEWSNLSTMNKIIEYMGFARPIVAFDLLEHRRSALDAAVYVEPNNTEGFATEIRRLLEDTPRREWMSAFARQRFATELCWETSCETLVAGYDQLILGGRGEPEPQDAKSICAA